MDYLIQWSSFHCGITIGEKEAWKSLSGLMKILFAPCLGSKFKYFYSQRILVDSSQTSLEFLNIISAAVLTALSSRPTLTICATNNLKIIGSVSCQGGIFLVQ